MTVNPLTQLRRRGRKYAQFSKAIPAQKRDERSNPDKYRLLGKRITERKNKLSARATEWYVNYNNRPEVKERRREYSKMRNQIPEVKAKKKKWRMENREYEKAYRSFRHYRDKTWIKIGKYFWFIFSGHVKISPPI